MDQNHHSLCLPSLLALALAIPLAAQPQIGGGTCSSSTLNGTYSLTLSGRDVSSSVVFSNIVQGIGLATFDGLSKVTFTLSNNSNKSFATPQTLSGTYSLQSNCIGAVNITTGDTASFILGSYASGTDFFVTGQDGTYSFIGNGNTQPAGTCSASQFSGTYAFNGNGFALNSNAIAGTNYISGLMTFDGVGVATGNWYVATGAPATAVQTTGTFTVNSNCTATATLADKSGNSYALTITITNVTTAAGVTNYVFSGSNSTLMFMGNGRTL
jgi:hypothetical protein